MTISTLPIPIIERIISLFCKDGATMVACASVCKSWRAVAEKVCSEQAKDRGWRPEDAKDLSWVICLSHYKFWWRLWPKVYGVKLLCFINHKSVFYSGISPEEISNLTALMQVGMIAVVSEQ